MASESNWRPLVTQLQSLGFACLLSIWISSRNPNASNTGGRRYRRRVISEQISGPDISENPFKLLPYIENVNVDALIIANLWYAVIISTDKSWNEIIENTVRFF